MGEDRNVARGASREAAEDRPAAGGWPVVLGWLFEPERRGAA